MTKKEASSLTSKEQVQQQSCTEDRLPPNDEVTNMTSPNRRQLSSSPPPRISTSSSLLSDSDSPGSYTSYSSAEYSSLGGRSEGEGVAQTYESGERHSDNTNCVEDNDPNRRVLSKSTIRTKNSSNTGIDNEFSYGLLSQVHKMQSLLEEYQHSLTALELEKADNQQEMNRLDKRLKSKGETEERYKEEVWNLELKNQDLNQRLEELNQCYVKSKSETTQHVRLGVTLSQEVEQLKAMKQTWEQKLQQAQTDHEKELVNLKKTLHASKSEKESLSKQIQDLIAEQAATAAAVHLRHISNKEIKDEETMPPQPLPTSVSMSGITQEIVNNKNIMSISTEVITLKKSLDQAHEIIQSMQEKIDKEREERLEVDSLLREAQETIETFRTISHNNSTQWYPLVQSPALRAANSDREHFKNPLSPMSPSSTHSNYSRNSDHNIGKSCRKTLAAAVLKSPTVTRSGGKSLCDELTQAVSIGNFASSMTDFNDSLLKTGVAFKEEMETIKTQSDSPPVIDDFQKESNSSPKFIMNDQQGINRICSEEEKNVVHSTETGVITKQVYSVEGSTENALESKASDIGKLNEQTLINNVSVKITELSQIDLPSISNHEIYSSFSSKTSSSRSTAEEGEDSYNEEIEVTVPKRNVHYGSLLKKPESYIYKSRRELDEEISRQKKAVTKAMLANVTIEKAQKSKLGLGSKEFNGRKGDNVDDKSVSALTRTMIGDWMWKYTRKVVGSGISENKHRRFFWIHPYTQTLYWSSKEPGSNNRQSNTKSVLVESFAILDNDSEPEKSIPPSILIKTPSRGLKIQCMNIIAHQAWIKSLNFLLDGGQTEDETPMDNVSKQHYIQRKMSMKKLQPVIDTSSTIATSTKDDNSSFIDISRVPFKFEPIATMTIDDLMPLPSPTVFTL